MASFRAAFAAVGKRHNRVLIEETVSGTVYRFFCVADRVVAIRFSRPANVEGDGTHTIADLVELKNAEQRLNPSYAKYSLRFGQQPIESDHFKGGGSTDFLSLS